LAWLSFAALLFVIAVALGFLFMDGASCNGPGLDELSFSVVFSNVGSFVWAYAGVSFYLEMLAEMKEPKDFAKKSCTGALVIATSLYAVVSCVTFAKCGDATPTSLVNVIPEGPWLRVCSAVLIFHMLVTYSLNNQVLVKGMFHAVGSRSGVEPGSRGQLVWCVVATVTTVIAGMITMAIPQFDNINNLIGNFCAAGCMILPGLFFWVIQRRHGKDTFATWLICFFMMTLGLSLFVLGMESSMVEIAKDWKSEGGKPFSCHPQ